MRFLVPLFLLVSCPVFAQPTDLAVSEVELRERLRVPMDVDWEAVSLRHAFDAFREALQINVVVDWEALYLLGILQTDQVSLRLRRVPAEIVLEMLLRKASVDVPFGWQVRGNVLLVSTREVLDGEMVVRIYDVRPLVQVVRRSASADHLIRMANPAEREATAARRADAIGDDGGIPLCCPDPSVLRSYYDLIEVIEQTVEPDAWAQNGGLATVVQHRGMLVVRSSARVHNELMQMLTTLAQSLDEQPPVVREVKM